MLELKRVKDYFSKEQKSNLISHALREFQMAGWMDENGNFKEDEPDESAERIFGMPLQEFACLNVLQILDTFHEQGHSGFSATYVINLVDRLIRFKPLTEITNNSIEWVLVADDLYQNRRCGHIFKNSKGEVWDIEGIIFKDEENPSNFYTNANSRVYVTLPYDVPNSPVYMFEKDIPDFN